MTTEQLLKILKERRFTLKLLPTGSPAIAGPVAEATPALLRVLGIHRERLIELLKRGEVN